MLKLVEPVQQVQQMLLWPVALENGDTDTNGTHESISFETYLDMLGDKSGEGGGVSLSISGGRTAMPSQVISRRAPRGPQEIRYAPGKISFPHLVF